MTESPALRQKTVHLQLTWDGDVDAGYLRLTDIGSEEAASQRIVENPVAGMGDIVLDFDERGRLLGVEFLDHRLLPPGISAT